ncbi:MAG: hypothetical protein H7829_17075, partial [Magnetococcus sp. THC-1_WYH]
MAGVLNTLGGLQDNPYAGKMARELAMDQIKAKSADASWRSRFDAEQSALNDRQSRQLASIDANREAQRQFQLEMLKARRAERPPEPLLTVAGPDGRPVYVPRSQAVGKSPYSQQPQQQYSGIQPSDRAAVAQQLGVPLQSIDPYANMPP